MTKRVIAYLGLVAVCSREGASSAEPAPSWMAIPGAVGLTPGNGPLGNSGYVSVSYFTGPHGSGNPVGALVYCSQGATDTSRCAPQFLYSATQLVALYQNLHRSTLAGATVTQWLAGSYAAPVAGLVQFH